MHLIATAIIPVCDCTQAEGDDVHIPDGFIDAPVAVAAGAASVAGIALSVRKAADELDDRRAPMAGLVAAFVFAVQMLNFPSPRARAVTCSGVLAAVLVGPWTGAICISLVLLVQALLFADGGLSALGLNILNMAFVGGGRGRRLPRHQAFPAREPPLRRDRRRHRRGVSVVLASLAFVAEYALGGGRRVDPRRAHRDGWRACVDRHRGGVITALTVGAVMSVRPDLVYGARDLLPRLDRRRAAWSPGVSMDRRDLVGVPGRRADRGARPRVLRESAREQLARRPREGLRRPGLRLDRARPRPRRFTAGRLRGARCRRRGHEHGPGRHHRRGRDVRRRATAVRHDPHGAGSPFCCATPSPA